MFHVEAVVTVVDAEHGLDTLSWSAEARKQAILADRLVITKTDIAGESAGAALAARLRALNPGAEILEAVNGELDPSRLTEPAADQRNPFVAEAAHSRRHRQLRADARARRCRGRCSRAPWTP